MSFNSLDFLIFLSIVVVLYYVLPQKMRNFLLLVVSYLFYASYNVPLVLFLVLCTLANYLVGLKMERVEKSVRKRWFFFGIVLNVAVLVFYKYLNFAIETLNNVAKTDFSLVKVIVPLGISFIIFSSISYLVDVYQRIIEPERRVLHFALYLAFFPKVVQGPIAKAGDILPQFDEQHPFKQENFRVGCLQVLYGLFMKMVIADRAAVVVNTIYGSLDAYSGAAITLATVLFALQIYFDFAGYSLTAIGAAHLLGFNLKDNFRQPYLSSSVGEFWHRWHMSLNRWLTDYIYIPLGGSRCSLFHRDVNTLITFSISGLWHGADWGYVVWGVLNGTYIVIEKRVKTAWNNWLGRGDAVLSPPPKKEKKYSFFGSARTFILVSIAWIFFRAQTLESSVTAIRRIFTRFDLSGFVYWITECFGAEEPVLYGLSVQSWICLFICLVVGLIVDIIAQTVDIPKRLASGNTVLRWGCLYVLTFAIIIFGMYGYGYSADNFIYAQF